MDRANTDRAVAIGLRMTSTLALSPINDPVKVPVRTRRSASIDGPKKATEAVWSALYMLLKF